MATATARAVQRLSYEQIAYVAYVAGFRGDSLVKAVAISAAESGRNRYATNDNRDGSTDRGLWQINSRAWPNVTPDMAFTPSAAAKAAFSISRSGTNFSPWVAYTNGAYLAHIPMASVAARRVGDPKDREKIRPGLVDVVEGTKDAVGIATAPLDPLVTVGKLAWRLTDRETWVRILMVTGGGGAMIIGLIILARGMK